MEYYAIRFNHVDLITAKQPYRKNKLYMVKTRHMPIS